MTDSYPSWDRRALLLANLAIVAVYVAAHWVRQAFGLPAVGMPLFLPAGVAFALCATLGWRVLPGVLLGALLMHLPVAWLPGMRLGHPALATAAVTLGSTLQAALGAWAFRRWIDPALDSVRDVSRFLVLAPAMCVVSATLATATLYWLGALTRAGLPASWLSWWSGDTLGVLLAAPLCWIVAASPRSLWRSRARLVGLPLLLAGAAVFGAYKQAVQWETDKELTAFRLQAQQVADLVQAGFSEHMRFSELLARALDDGQAIVPQERFHRLASGYTEGRKESIRVYWMTRVLDSERPALEAWARQHVDPHFAISEIGPGDGLRPAARRSQYFVLLYAAPPSMAMGLGLDYLSGGARADAMARMTRTGRPTATAPMLLVPQMRPGIVLLRGVGDSPAAPAAAVAVILDANNVVRNAFAQIALADAGFELRDRAAGGALAAGQPFSGPQRGQVQRSLRFADRRYLFTVVPGASYFSTHYGLASWTVLSTGLVAVGLLGALMLLTSGERARIAGLVAERTARLQAILDNVADAIVTVDADGKLLSANRATENLFGPPAPQLAGRSLDSLAPLGGAEPGPALERLARAPPEQRELQGVNAHGAPFPLSIAVAPLRLADEQLYVCILRDLTEHQRSQQSIYRLAHYDILTGLVNRHALDKRLEEHLAQARRNGAPVALLFIDLDHFKKINDTHGHAAGDELLVGAARRMDELLRHDVDTLARLGGDEFVIVLGGPLTPDSVSTVAARLVHSLAQPYQLQAGTVHSGSSVGIALFPDDAADAGTLMRHADTAMYAAKREGRGNFQFFSEAMNAATREHMLLEGRMRTALAADDLELHLQAQVELDTGRVIGAEMLLRWHDSELGQVEPSRAIAVAEECGLILPLGDWVLARAMQQLADWQRDGMGALRLAVNLSARQFAGGNLLARLDQLLARHRINPARLELEITETAAMRDPENTRRLLRQLHERGFKLAIDDFGTGYSSLAYLKLFAIDRIKIDRGFVHDIETDPNDAAIVAATIGLAHALGLEVVAEGVETQAQWSFLRAKHSDEAQGFLFARPMPAAQFRDFVREREQPVPGP